MKSVVFAVSSIAPAKIDGEGQLVAVGDMAGQLNCALDNLETVLAARLEKAGCRPAAMLLGVTRLAFPELLVEIEATAAE